MSDPTVTEPKPWYASKTILANLLAAAAVVAGVFGIDLGLTPEVQAELVAGAMVVINIVLRFMTKAPIA